MSKVIGIDLGSTLSEVAVIEGGKATVVANEDGSYDLTGGKNTIYVTLTSAQDENLVTNYKITINKPETLEESSSTLNTIKAKKKFNVMPVVIAVIVVLAV